MDQQSFARGAADVLEITSTAPRALEVGSAVGAERWPDTYWHGDGWGIPWRGVLLAVDDPRAWAGSGIAAKIPGNPTRAECRAHITHLEKLWAECPATACRAPLFSSTVMVLWDFGRGALVVYREDAAKVRSYREDVAAWKLAMEAARAEWKAHVAARKDTKAA